MLLRRRDACFLTLRPGRWPANGKLSLWSKFHADPMHVAQWRAFVRRIGEPDVSEDLPVVAAAVREFILPIRAPGPLDGELSLRASAGSFDATFYAVQLLELAAGATNVTLLALNVRDGLRLAGRLRAPVPRPS
jgi:hypothetical protein